MAGRTVFVQGNEAIVEASLYAGLDFYAGYPITPSSEVAELLAERLPRKGGRFIQMEDEIASICAIIGASLTGLKVMTATSGPGFSLMQEGIGFAVMAEIPCVIVNVQRGGPSTGLPDPAGPGRRDAGAVGHPRRAQHRGAHGLQPPGRVRHDRRSLQHCRDLSHPGHPAARRGRGPHAGKGRDPGAGGARPRAAPQDLGAPGHRLPSLLSPRGWPPADVGFRRLPPLQRHRPRARHVGFPDRPIRG